MSDAELAAIVRSVHTTLTALYGPGGKPRPERPPRLLDAVDDLPRGALACGRKVAYISRSEARLAIKGLRSHEGCTQYRCPGCGLWHNGHPRREWEPRLRARAAVDSAAAAV